MFDRRPGRCAGATVVPGNHHVIALALGHTGGNRAHTDFGHQLDTDGAVRCHVLQIVDQLRQIFNRINVMVRRRRNQAHTGHRVAQAADVVGHLATWQLTALAGLGTLGHLDLDLVGAGQVLRGHTKAARGDLLDARTQAVSPAFSGISTSTTSWPMMSAMV
jgi:hypothetical protein